MTPSSYSKLSGEYVCLIVMPCDLKKKIWDILHTELNIHIFPVHLILLLAKCMNNLNHENSGFAGNGVIEEQVNRIP